MFNAFAEIVRAANLQPKDCGNGHWQVMGGNFKVNFYPFALSGPSFYINGTHKGFRRRKIGTTPKEWAEFCIEAANEMPQKFVEHPKRPKETRKIRKKLHYHRGNGCNWCWRILTLETSTLDHIIPLIRGGSNGVDNLCLACYDCNQERGGDMTAIRTLKLHFRTAEKVEPCLAKLKENSLVNFTSEDEAIDPRDILTKPEYLEIKKIIKLTFDSHEDCLKFMRDPRLRTIYLESST